MNPGPPVIGGNHEIGVNEPPIRWMGGFPVVGDGFEPSASGLPSTCGLGRCEPNELFALPIEGPRANPPTQASTSRRTTSVVTQMVSVAIVEHSLLSLDYRLRRFATTT